MTYRAFFFDRDRTLIGDAPAGLASPAAHAPEHVQLLPGAVEALRMAKAAGYRIVVVTNQPGPAKGQYTRSDVAATNARLAEMCAARGAALDAIYACEHHPVGGPGGDPALIRVCDCRKPRPGLILRAAQELDLDLSRCALIGDDDRDMEAGQAAGVRTVRVGPDGPSPVQAVARALAELEERMER